MKKIFLATAVTAFCFSFLSAGCAKANDGESGGARMAAKEIYISVGGEKLKAELYDTAAAAALLELLEKGRLVYYADDYGGFEKVGDLGVSLPKSDVRVTSAPGDIFLYQGNKLCVFVGNNAYSYTKIGKITGVDEEFLRSFLKIGEGRVEITLSLD